MRTGITFTVTPEDRLRLEAIVSDRNAKQKHVKRARAILATAAGCGTNGSASSAGGYSSRHFAKTAVEIGMFGPHAAVPPREIEAKISRPVLMVHVVVSCCRNEPKNWMPCPSARAEFVGAVTYCIAQHHMCREEE